MTPTPTNADDVTVRQQDVTPADRKAAADLFTWLMSDAPLGRVSMGADNPLVQAFARHRIAHQSTGEVERLRDALSEIAGAHIGDQPASAGGSEHDWAVRRFTDLKRKALSALAIKGGGEQ